MRVNSLSFRLSVFFSIFISLVIIFTGLSLSFVYYIYTENDIHTTLKNRANELVNTHITYDGKELVYKNGPSGETIASKLRDFDISAVIFDASFTQIGTYGYYKNLNDNGKISSVADTAFLKTIATNKKSVYRDVWFSNTVLFDSFTMPLIFNGSVVGVLQILRQNTFLINILEIGIPTLLFVLPLSIFISIFFIFLLTKKHFAPLNTLIEYMETVDTIHLPKTLDLKTIKTDELKSVSIAFNSMLERLKEAIEKQQSYAAHLSHEIKTPLTRATSSLEVLQYNLTEQDTKTTSRVLHLVKTDLISIGKLIDTILHATGNSNGNEYTNHTQTAPLKKEIESIVETYAKDMRKKKLTVHVMCDDTWWIRISKEHFSIILTNLLSNAMKYTNPKGKITVTAYKEQNSLLALAIHNTGSSVKGAEKELIFKRFFRGENQKHISNGKGLGLTLVQDICTLNNLNLSLTSDTKGTEFIISGFQPSEAPSN